MWIILLDIGVAVNNLSQRNRYKANLSPISQN